MYSVLSVVLDNCLPSVDRFDPIQFHQPTPHLAQPEVPPYNGFGSEEDSLATCKQLIPKPPRKDFVKFMEKDRCACVCL